MPVEEGTGPMGKKVWRQVLRRQKKPVNRTLPDTRRGQLNRVREQHGMPRELEGPGRMLPDRYMGLDQRTNRFVPQPESELVSPGIPPGRWPVSEEQPGRSLLPPAMVWKGLETIKGPVGQWTPEFEAQLGQMAQEAGNTMKGAPPWARGITPEMEQTVGRAFSPAARGISAILRWAPLAAALAQVAELGGSTPQDQMRQRWYEGFQQREGVAGAPARFNPGPFRPPWR